LYTELLLYLKERINLIYNINVQVRTFTKFLKLKKYVGSYDTAVSSVNPKDLKRTVVEHYKLPAKKVRVLEHDVYPDGQVDLVASISNDILPTSYSFINRAHPYKLSEDVLKNIPMYN
jgi:hypothetical protein